MKKASLSFGTAKSFGAWEELQAKAQKSVWWENTDSDQPSPPPLPAKPRAHRDTIKLRGRGVFGEQTKKVAGFDPASAERWDIQGTSCKKHIEILDQMSICKYY